eukprot:762353-Lingulodinium_polyedra.AAC.1
MKQAPSLSITNARPYLPEAVGCTVWRDKSEDRVIVFYNQGGSRTPMSCQIPMYGIEVAIKK